MSDIRYTMNIREIKALMRSSITSRRVIYIGDRVKTVVQVLSGVLVEEHTLQLLDLFHLALDVLNVGIVGALQSGQLHAVHDFEGFAIILERVRVGILQVVYVLIEHDELTTRLLEFYGRFLELKLQFVDIAHLATTIGYTSITSIIPDLCN